MTADLPITKARHHARPMMGTSARYAQRSTVNPARCGNFKPALRITRRYSYGASASPLLANVYLHYVFDLWADQWRRRHARGDMILVRYADLCGHREGVRLTV
jgi:hypothetical protein